MSGSPRADGFIDAFNRIDNLLRSSTGLSDRSAHSFTQVLRAASDCDAYVRRQRDDLREYAELRNAIVHGPQLAVIAEPLPSTVGAIEAIAEYLSKPPSVATVMAKNPVVLSNEDSLAHAVRLMGAHDYSQLLVTSGPGLRLLNSEHIRCWLGTQIVDDVVSLGETRVGDVLACLDDDGLHCLSINHTVFDAIGTFEQSIDRGRERVYAIAVTQNGKRNEGALGIVTPWDLVLAGARFSV